MSELDRFDRTILDWLADASPMDVPSRVVDAATADARRTRRARTLPPFITRFLPMSTNVAVGSAQPLERPRLLFAVRPMWAIALTLLALALIGAALLSVGASPSPPAVVGNGLIAFDSNGDIWVSMADGSERAQVTSGPDIDISPSWSPDGSHIAFWRFANARTTDVAGFPQLVADVVFAPGAAASLVIIDATGSDTTVLIDGVIPRPDIPVAWSPEATRIAYTRSVGGSSQVEVTGLGDAKTQVVATPGEEPAWSPDGSQIAYSVPGTGIFVAASDGSGPRQLTQAPVTGSLAQPDWSADGSHIVLGAGPDGAHDIWVVGADGSDPHALVATPGDDWLADWSPTGAAIAYEQKAPGSDGYAFSLVYPDGTALPGPDFTQSNPGTLAWSPDGTRLLGFVNDPGAITNALRVLDASAAEPAMTIEAENNVGAVTWQRLAR